MEYDTYLTLLHKIQHKTNLHGHHCKNIKPHMFEIYLHIQFKIPKCNHLLVITIKQKSKYNDDKLNADDENH